MNIESYEPYHIGIKLNPAIPIVILRKKLLPLINEIKLESSAGEEMPTNVVKEVIGRKGSTTVELNYGALALNTVGNNPAEVYPIFENILKLIEKIGYDLTSTIIFYEVLCNAIIKVDGVPDTIMNNSVKCDLTTFREIVSDLSVTGIQFDIGLGEEEKDVLRGFVQPSPINPRTLIGIRLAYQTKKSDRIVSFSKTIAERIQRFIGSLGGT